MYCFGLVVLILNATGSCVPSEWSSIIRALAERPGITAAYNKTSLSQLAKAGRALSRNKQRAKLQRMGPLRSLTSKGHFSGWPNAD